jgi:hypothetical protein
MGNPPTSPLRGLSGGESIKMFSDRLLGLGQAESYAILYSMFSWEPGRGRGARAGREIRDSVQYAVLGTGKRAGALERASR